MKKNIISVFLLASMPVMAQISNPLDNGTLERCKDFLLQNNYEAALDQLGLINFNTLSESQHQTACFLEAEAFFGRGNYEKAAEAFKIFLEKFPQSPDRSLARMRIADCSFMQSDFNKAIQLYLKAEPSGLDSANKTDFYYRLGIAYMQCHNLQKSAEYFSKITAANPRAAAARFYLGYIYFCQENYDEAEKYLRQTDKNVAPGNMADFYLAEIDYVRSNWRAAANTATSLLRSGKLNSADEAEMNRIAGEALYKLGDNYAAINHLKKYIAATPNPLPTACYILGIEEYGKGEYDLAIKHLRNVVDYDGKTLEDDTLTQSALLYLGQALYHQGDTSAAILAFDKAMKINTSDSSVAEAAFYNYAVAKFSGAAVPFSSAADTFEKFLTKYPDGPYSDRVAEYLAGGYLADKDYTKALARINAVKNPGPKLLATKQQVLYSLGAAEIASGNGIQAEKYLSQAAALAKYNTTTACETLLLRARAAAMTGNYQAAANMYAEYLRTSQKNAQNRGAALYGLGYAQFALKEYAEADKTFAQALDYNLGNAAKADILNRRADIKYYDSQFLMAAELYAQARAANPSNGDYAAFNEARMQGFARNYHAKLEALEKFRHDFPNSSLIPDALLETTQAQISIGQNDQAVETYKLLIEKYPLTAQGRRGYLQMAMTLLDMNRTEDAINAYKKVISLYPTSDEASQASGMLRSILADQGRGNEYLAFLQSVENAPQITHDEAEAVSFDSAMRIFKSRGDESSLIGFADSHPDSKLAPEAIDAVMGKAFADGRNEQAAELAARLLARYPDSPYAEEALKISASVDFSTGATPSALAKWKQLLEKASSTRTAADARLGIMRSARELGDYIQAGEAAQALLESTAIAPESVTEATFTIGLALEAQEKNDEAIEKWSSIAENTSDIYGVKAAFNAAQALFDQGKTDKAMKAAQALTSSGTPHRYWLARGFVLMSDIYAEKGKKFEAKEYLEALRDNYPGNEADIHDMIETRLSKLK